MFPFWGNACWGAEPSSHKTYQERKLKFLRWMRDDLETRLAGLNAAIDTIERQLNREDTAA
ncbi:MAG: hypothetical protein JOZ78_21940 [Chroococcidiopsidaceae cyanobacterium CP_BM_ER_R8_30]|nr:hypothetical protein [Chroococcidiopsidaceae cyanobacterium CP_BM_ER_R8_30]